MAAIPSHLRFQPRLAAFSWNIRLAVMLASVLLAAVVRAQIGLPVQVAPDVWKVGMLQLTNITESSGLIASRRFPGVVWTHNDSGFPAFLFAIDEQGAHLGSFEVKGARLIDWEAITFDEEGHLYLADIGTNGLARSHSAIHRIEEPNPHDRSGPATILKTWYLRFPGERDDCESFFIADGYGYVIRKIPVGGLVPMYRFALADNSSSVLLEKVAEIPVLGKVSDATLSLDKTLLALLTSEGVYVVFINGNPLSVGAAPRQFTKYKDTYAEGITFMPDGLLVTHDTSHGQVPRDLLLFTSPQLLGRPVFSLPPGDQSAFAGGAVEFKAAASGYPEPAYQWRKDGLILAGQTNSFLTLTNLAIASSGVYEVSASNARGSASASARLTVSEKKPDLRITEAMSSEGRASVPAADWWELTSFNATIVNLSGWRFNDSIGGVRDAFRIPEGTMIRPGESVIFVEALTPAQFRAWWGETNLPPALQIITYSGLALSLGAGGDSVRLWDNLTSDDNATIARADFGPADPGVSFTYDPSTQQFGMKSLAGTNGAFHAASGGGTGSPGRIIGVQSASLFKIEAQRFRGGTRISFTGETGNTYTLQSRSSLTTGAWVPAAEPRQATNTGPLRFEIPQYGPSYFFRVVRNP